MYRRWDNTVAAYTNDALYKDTVPRNAKHEELPQDCKGVIQEKEGVKNKHPVKSTLRGVIHIREILFTFIHKKVSLIREFMINPVSTYHSCSVGPITSLVSQNEQHC